MSVAGVVFVNIARGSLFGCEPLEPFLESGQIGLHGTKFVKTEPPDPVEMLDHVVVAQPTLPRLTWLHWNTVRFKS